MLISLWDILGPWTDGMEIKNYNLLIREEVTQKKQLSKLTYIYNWCNLNQGHHNQIICTIIEYHDNHGQQSRTITSLEYILCSCPILCINTHTESTHKVMSKVNSCPTHWQCERTHTQKVHSLAWTHLQRSQTVAWFRTPWTIYAGL